MNSKLQLLFYTTYLTHYEAFNILKKKLTMEQSIKTKVNPPKVTLVLTKLFYKVLQWQTRHSYRVIAIPFDWDSQKNRFVITNTWSVARFQFVTLYVFVFFGLKFLKCIQAYLNGDHKKLAYGTAMVFGASFIWSMMVLLSLKWRHALSVCNEVLHFFNEIYSKLYIIYWGYQ